MISKRVGVWLLVVLTVVLGAAVALAPRIGQPKSYHQFADQRGWLGIPNFGDVASNLPFVMLGVWGLIFLSAKNNREIFEDSRERWPYVCVFLGLVLTAFGSAYYHWTPNNDRLMWDRLPMTIVFMALVAGLIAERMNVSAGIWLLPVLLGLGIFSVAQWHLSELRGHGDLRLYAAVQLYALLVLVLMLFLPEKYKGGEALAIVAACYVLAKLLETYDKRIFHLGGVVSGHTLKHLAAATAGYWILRMLQARKEVQS